MNQREKLIFPVFRGEHINFLARLTPGQPAVCPKAIWTLTRAKVYVYVPFCSQNVGLTIGDKINTYYKYILKR